MEIMRLFTKSKTVQQVYWYIFTIGINLYESSFEISAHSADSRGPEFLVSKKHWKGAQTHAANYVYEIYEVNKFFIHSKRGQEKHQSYLSKSTIENKLTLIVPVPASKDSMKGVKHRWPGCKWSRQKCTGPWFKRPASCWTSEGQQQKEILHTSRMVAIASTKRVRTPSRLFRATTPSELGWWAPLRLLLHTGVRCNIFLCFWPFEVPWLVRLPNQGSTHGSTNRVLTGDI